MKFHAKNYLIVGSQPKMECAMAWDHDHFCHNPKEDLKLAIEREAYYLEF